ncbi:MAG: leucyl aminopeptidase [Myxococcales bacterium]|nr:leucyl aminopeptidase [Myxococcales bacterium]
MAEVERLYDAAALVRDLVNTPANDMGPDELEAAARDLAEAHGAKIKVIKGDSLLKQNFPMVHAVGRASVREPRLIDIRWGSTSNPRVSLVGKGVCFDTGGLNLKPGSSMLKMKKDMGGAAHVLGLASLIMDAELPVCLRVLVPAVENSIGGRAYRPGDVLPSRKGITVEIGNTDAEGRLVLADALALADSESPEVLFNMATLTGAARVALGADLPPFYTTDDVFAAELCEQGEAVNDPVWRMPFWRNYRRFLDSKIADINHISSSRYAGSITAALFLKEFVESAKLFVHFDVYAWTDRSSPGRPAGAEAQAIRAMYEVLKSRYPST